MNSHIRAIFKNSPPVFMPLRIGTNKKRMLPIKATSAKAISNVYLAIYIALTYYCKTFKLSNFAVCFPTARKPNPEKLILPVTLDIACIPFT